jgi:hypothetical protein
MSSEFVPRRRAILQSKERYGLSFGDLSDLFRKAYPMLSLTDERRRKRDKATLWVGFDLRRGLDEQLQEARENLRIVKDGLDEIFGPRRTRKFSLDVAWRNLHCFLLADRVGLSAKEIAAEVFPADRGAAERVRKILSDIRERLRTTASLPSTHKGREP